MAAPKLRDVRKLADSRAVFDLNVALSELPDFPAEYVAGGGSVHAQLVFGREQGFAMAQLSMRATLQVMCQRCLAPMPLSVEASSPVLIVESEQEAENAPAGWETFLAPEGRLRLEALIGEELLLAMPIVPLHAAIAQCTPAMPRPVFDAAVDAPTDAPESSQGTEPSTPPAAGEAPAESAPATVRPFADLRALLERGAKSGGREPH